MAIIMRGRTDRAKAAFRPNFLKASLNKYMLITAVIEKEPYLPVFNIPGKIIFAYNIVVNTLFAV